MPYIDNTVKNINATLLADIFSKGKLSGSKLFELGYIQKRTGDEADYVIMGLEGDDGVDLTHDDTFPCVLYHRMLASGFSKVNETGFGDDPNADKQTYTMTSVVWAKRSIGIHESTFAERIADSLNKVYDESEISDLELAQLQTRAVSVNFDSEQVWANEYKNTNYPFGVEEVMFFSIQYLIESSYSKGCFNMCPEC